MSIEAYTWALTDTKVGDATRKLVLAGLANHAHKDGRHAFPSKATLADYAECSPKTVGRHLKVLLDDGWIREGDQQTVAHLRADRRPVVYDVAMSETTRLAWQTERAATNTPTPRGDNLSPRTAEATTDPGTERGDNLSPRETGHGGTHGGTKQASRGDTAVSPEPYEPLKNPPTPHSACRRHQAPVDNCRGCGTTDRQIRERADRAATARRRAADQAAAAEQRARRAAGNGPAPAGIRDVVTAAKAAADTGAVR